MEIIQLALCEFFEMINKLVRIMKKPWDHLSMSETEYHIFNSIQNTLFPWLEEALHPLIEKE